LHVQLNLFEVNTTLGVLIMKNIVRAFVVVLALTGAAATTMTPTASAQHKVALAKTSMLPVPMCPPNDPNACGIAGSR
jgi:hypothetical protein